MHSVVREAACKRYSTSAEGSTPAVALRLQPVSRVTASQSFPPAEKFFPRRITLAGLRRAVDGCRACPLFRATTRGVGGEGPAGAPLMLVGEEPGDHEDRAGRPFVGGAGRMLDECLAEAGIARGGVYVTNAVKHFKFEPRGKRRIHQKPSITEVRACSPWLLEEARLVAPRLVVCLGATAARAVIGAGVRVTRDHGRIFETALAPRALATYHPSAVLRAPRDRREELRSLLVGDLLAAKQAAR